MGDSELRAGGTAPQPLQEHFGVHFVVVRELLVHEGDACTGGGRVRGPNTNITNSTSGLPH